MNVFLSSAYFPPIEYFVKLRSSDHVFLEVCENYLKQTYRNRCSILSANGSMPLTIPVESQGGQKCPIRDIQISDHGNWRHLHWNALVSAYKSSPFFEYYEDDIRPFFEKKYKFLFDFNEEIRVFLCGLLDIDNSKVCHTSEFVLPLNGVENIDFRYTISPKMNWREFDTDFIAVPYYQVFDNKFGFIPNLSIVDLLFNMGNESLIVLDKCNKKTF